MSKIPDKPGPPYKCMGIKGKLFGHKFTMLSNCEYRYWSDSCYRCGMPKGGWVKC